MVTDAERRAALQEMVRISEELGLYDQTEEDLYCKRHDRHEPCRFCAREGGL